jgi:hypothetical protein
MILLFDFIFVYSIDLVKLVELVKTLDTKKQS